MAIYQSLINYWRVQKTHSPFASTPGISLHFANESGIVQVHWIKLSLLSILLRWAQEPELPMTLTHGHVLVISNLPSKGSSLSLDLIYSVRWSWSLLAWEPFCLFPMTLHVYSQVTYWSFSVIPISFTSRFLGVHPTIDTKKWNKGNIKINQIIN